MFEAIAVEGERVARGGFGRSDAWGGMAGLGLKLQKQRIENTGMGCMESGIGERWNERKVYLYSYGA